MQKRVVIGFLGTQLDGGLTEKRWERWRPSVAVCGHGDTFPVDELVLLSTGTPQSESKAAALLARVTEDIAAISPRTKVSSHSLGLADPWDFTEVYARLHDFARGYEFAEDTEYLVHLTTGTHIAQICLFLLTEARYLPANILESSYTPQDVDWRGHLEVIDLNLARYDQLASRFAREREQGEGLLKDGIATRNASFNRLISKIEKVALSSSAPLLLTGPTGAGKSQLARRIYQLKAQRNLTGKAFVEVNCATLRGDGAMSALFGHKKGAFTGAASDREGLLRSANGGMLFLDEIGELGLDEQAMLLHALEEKRYFPVGSDKEVSSDFQLIAGTNKELKSRVRAGLFREDLLARINLWTFALPGLAERPEDIEPNLDYELARIATDTGTNVTMSAEARRAYLSFAHIAPWPGNFRDFNASLVRMSTLAVGGRITMPDVEEELAYLKSAASQGDEPPREGVDAVTAFVREMGVDPFDEFQLVGVLRVVRDASSLAEAGRILYSKSRQLRSSTNDSDRLKKYLGKFELSFDAVKKAFSA